MLNKLPQIQKILEPDCADPAMAVEYINSYVDEFSCETLCVDISSMNVLDACYVSTLCSTNHYIKYPSGRIHWKISSEKVCELNKDLELGNSEYLF